MKYKFEQFTTRGKEHSKHICKKETKINENRKKKKENRVGLKDKERKTKIYI